jgi:GMP synthase (glutamine-hydrolysing)
MKPVVALRHVPHEDLGTIAAAFRDAGIVIRTLDLFDGVPEKFDPQEFAGLIVMGGPMNVDETEKYPFLATEVAWIQAAVQNNLPVLGICLGAQLLAKALGAKVIPNGIKEIGWYPLSLLPPSADDRLFSSLPKELTVFQWHGDTFDLPLGATQLAASVLCQQQAFRIGRSAYGLQFHLEITAEMVEDWLCESGGCGEIASLDYIDPAQIRERTPTAAPRLNQYARRVFTAFAELCREHDEQT